jgi:hypothetical protein
MDALEARLVTTQDVPPKADLRWYAIRADQYEQLTSRAALDLLQKHFPPRPVTEMDRVEMIAEIDFMRAEVRRMQPVCAAAKAWRAGRQRDVDAHGEARSATGVALIDAVDAAVATEGQ